MPPSMSYEQKLQYLQDAVMRPNNAAIIAHQVFFLLSGIAAPGCDEFEQDMIAVVDTAKNDSTIDQALVDKWIEKYKPSSVADPKPSAPKRKRKRSASSESYRPDSDDERKQLPSQVFKSWADIEPSVTTLLDNLEDNIKAFLQKPIEDSWQPSSVWDKFPEQKNKLREMNIPRKLTNECSLPMPDLLFYSLGSPESLDETFLGRLNHQIDDASSLFFANASGSGKTRMILEILAKNYGIFINCGRFLNTNPHGSTDYEALIQYVSRFRLHPPHFKSDLTDYRSKQQSAQNIMNEHIAKHGIQLLMLARFLVFERFSKVCQAERKVNDGPMLWLLLQLQPDIGPNSADIFTLVFTSLRDLDVNDESPKTSIPIKIFRFLAFDEIQTATMQFPHAFLSHGFKDRFRSFARPLLYYSMMTLARKTRYLLAGTKLCLNEIESQWLTSKLKDRPLAPIYDLGDHNGPSDVYAYIIRFVGEDVFNSWPSSLQRKIGFWFSGRYRFAATLVQWILLLGPDADVVDQIIENIISKFAGADKSPNVVEIPNMHYDPLIPRIMLADVTDGALAEAQRAAAFFIISGRPFPLSKNGSRVVEEGIARFYGSDSKHQVFVKENIVLLGLTQCFLSNDSGPRSLTKFLNDRLQDNNASGAGTAFEDVMAFVFFKMFSGDGATFDTALSFVDPNVPFWKSQRARLISVLRENIPGGSEHILAHIGGTSGIGYRSNHPSETAAWFVSTMGKPFLMPDVHLGPDIVFALTLDNGQVIFVCVQCKYGKTDLGPKGLQQAFFTTSPEHFYQSSNIKDSADYVWVRNEIFKALERFPLPAPGMTTRDPNSPHLQNYHDPMTPVSALTLPPLPPRKSRTNRSQSPTDAESSTNATEGDTPTIPPLEEKTSVKAKNRSPIKYDSGPAKYSILRVYAGLGQAGDDPETHGRNTGSYPLAFVPQSVYERAIKEWNLTSFQMMVEHHFYNLHSKTAATNKPAIASGHASEPTRSTLLVHEANLIKDDAERSEKEEDRDNRDSKRVRTSKTVTSHHTTRASSSRGGPARGRRGRPKKKI